MQIELMIQRNYNQMDAFNQAQRMKKMLGTLLEKKMVMYEEEIDH
jgi:hypothetical protein